MSTESDEFRIIAEDEHGNQHRHSACFTFQTVGEQLSERDIDWAFYSADPYQAGYIWQAYSAIEDVFTNEQLWDEHIWPVDDLMRDIDAKIQRNEERAKGLKDLEARVGELKQLHAEALERSTEITANHAAVKQADDELRARLVALRGGDDHL